MAARLTADCRRCDAEVPLEYDGGLFACAVCGAVMQAG